MIQFQSLLFLIFIIKELPVIVDGRFFEYELPNRSITICPSYSLISIECPQISSSSASDNQLWQSNLPKYLISIDYIRSFPLRLGFDPRSCQPDFSHACNNYDLRYINTLCNGKSHCSDISTYQIRERSVCAFKAVTEIGFHCVPTWNLYDIQTKYDICQNSSLTNDYGFIYSRNYPLKTNRISCFTTIYTRPNYKIILYYVNGELNHDQLRIESVTSENLSILNISLNGNLTTQRLGASIYQMKITFLPSQIYSYHPTYYLLYFYTVPICSINEPCPSGAPGVVTTPFILPTMTTIRTRIQSIGWTRVHNLWIVIPVILAYILLLLLVVVLALLFRRRQKQRKLLEDIGKTHSTTRYLDASGASSRAQLVTSLSPSPPVNNNTFHHTNVSQNIHYPSPLNSSFSQNIDRHHRSSRSEFDLHSSGNNNNIINNGIDPRHHASIPYRIRPGISYENPRGYDTIDYNYDGNRSQRRSLPKSFSDCDLCKRRVVNEEHQQYFNEQNDNWHLENNTLERKNEPRTYRDRIKERFRDRIITHQIPDNEHLSPLPPITTTTANVEYSTVVPRHQRIGSETNRSVQHLPFEYIPNDGNNLTVKYYEHGDDERKTSLNRRLNDPREIQEISMRMNDQQNFNRHQYYH